ncbi:lipoprotein signal peptidase [Lachnospiraceae bacterium KM106-2]|nr:lipoprotein signal peptidase [Lachnospiraceae bacterium KM106-2]
MGYLLVIVIIVCVEGYIKSRVEKNINFGTEEPLFNGKIILQKYHNKGVALNILENSTKLIKWVTGVIIGILLVCLGAMIYKKNSKLLLIGLSLIIGGAVSNLTDRMEKGYVVDYFSFNHGKKLKNIVFNLADMCVFLGALFVLIGNLIKKR